MLRRSHEDVTARITVLLRIVQGLMLLIAVGYWAVQITDGAYYRELAENNRLRRLRVEAPRGVIRDRHGLPMVENVPGYSLLIDRSRTADLDASLAVVADKLRESPADLKAILRKYQTTPATRPVKLATGLSLAEVMQLEAISFEHREYEIEIDSRRLYRFGPHTAHLIGYLGEVSPTELAKNQEVYNPGDHIGKKGIEQKYDLQLRGQNGAQLVVVDSRGQEVEELESEPAVPGGDLKLTIDLGLQQLAAQLLDEMVGTVVALDPRNGDVLALVSQPSFDPNIFTRRLSHAEWRELIDNPFHPLQNRALQNAYPPGSVFKIVTAMAALEEGVVDPSFSVFCPGYSIVYGNRFRCWKKGGHGTVNLQSAIKGSCNVYFHALGQRLKIDTIARYARKFGLGQVSGIDLDGERAGLVPDTRWAEERRKQPWYPGETISVVTGQGPILVTPMQMAVMMSAVANGGTLYPPRLYRDPAEKASAGQPLGFDAGHLQLIRNALWAVVNDGGTANSARVNGLEIAGKTGTAQVVRQETWTDNSQLEEGERDHAWFASFAPTPAPEIAIVVFVEHGGGGYKTAAPIAKALYEKYFQSHLAHRAGDPAP